MPASKSQHPYFDKILNNNVVCKRYKAGEQMTHTGIYIPGKDPDAPSSGTVVAVGPGKMNDMGVTIPMSVEVGDFVIYRKYNAAEFQDGYQGEAFDFVSEDVILASLSKPLLEGIQENH